jgi:hypothetical protein
VFNVQYSSVFCVNKSSQCWTYNIPQYFEYWGIYCMLNTVGRFIYTKYWGILYVENCEKIYLHKILRNSECWSLCEDILTQNTEEYFKLSTVGRFIYTQYWGILYVQHTVLSIQYSSVFWVTKSSHSVQHTVFLSILFK